MRIGIYLRTSTDQQREKRTIESQRQDLLALVERERHELVDLYADDGLSGTLGPEDRPDFRRLLQDVALGRMEAVAVVAQDRLSRPDELVDLARWKTIFKHAHVKVITPSQVLDLESADDDFMSDLYGILAKRERQQILARCMSGRRRVAREGGNPGFEAPFGWHWNRDTRRFELDEREARVVRHAFHLCIDEDLGLGGIAVELGRLLRAEGAAWAPRRKERWGKSNVRRMLEARSTGFIAYNTRRVRSKSVGGRLRVESVEPRPKSEWIKIPLPQIVSQERYVTARRALEARATFAPRNRRRPYLLSGLLRCGECSARLVGEWTSGRRYYVCHTVRKRWNGRTCSVPWLRADDLEAAVWSEVKRVLSDPALVRSAVDAALPPPTADPEGEIRKWQTRLDATAGQVTKIDRAYRQGKMPEQRWLDQIAEVENEKRLYQRNIDELRNAAETARARAEQVARIVEDANNVDFENATWDDRRKLLVALCHAPDCGIFVFADRRVEVRGVLRPAGEVEEKAGVAIRMEASA